MLQIGFQDIVAGRLRCRYEKLTNGADDEKVVRPRRRWVKKMNGRLKGFRLSRSRKLILKAFSEVVLPSRIARIYAEIVDRMKMDGSCPNIIFTQWGLPVLSHPSIKFRKEYQYHLC